VGRELVLEGVQGDAGACNHMLGADTCMRKVLGAQDNFTRWCRPARERRLGADRQHLPGPAHNRRHLIDVVRTGDAGRVATRIVRGVLEVARDDVRVGLNRDAAGT
jgi:hypothetical protein